MLSDLCSRRRLYTLTNTPPSSATMATVNPVDSLIPSASGLSIESLRDVIKRFERSIEADLMVQEESDGSIARLNKPIAVSFPSPSKVRLRPSQMQMIVWLRELPFEKYVTWFPEVANSHAVIIVR